MLLILLFKRYRQRAVSDDIVRRCFEKWRNFSLAKSKDDFIFPEENREESMIKCCIKKALKKSRIIHKNYSTYKYLLLR